MPPPSYEQQIVAAKTKNELINLKKRIVNSLYLKTKNIDGKLLKLITDKMDNMNDNKEADEEEEKVVEPPPAKRSKLDDIRKLHTVKYNAEVAYDYYKTMIKDKTKIRNDIINKMDKFMINEDDIGEDFLTNLVTEVDRIKNVAIVKQYADIFNITTSIRSYIEVMNKERNNIDIATKQLNDYLSNN